MNISAQRVNSFQFEKEQQLFFDTNIWIFIYGAHNTPGDQRVKTYSRALKRAKNAGATIFIDGVVVGELINRGVRDDYAFHHPPQPGRMNFKTYRQTPEYAASARAVASSVRAILRQCQLVESVFASCDIETELSGFESGQTDWSDQMIVALCHEHNLILMTDDGDFGESGLIILTRNPVYFMDATNA